MSKEKRKQGIASRMKRARQASGLTQGQVAKQLKIHRPTVSEIEAGRRSVSAEEVAEFAELYGVNTNWILEGSDVNSSENDKIVLAARQLSRLKDKDLDRLMHLLQMLRGDGGNSE